MDQRISLITLGVDDLGRAVDFYSKLDWSPGNDWREQGVAFFQCVGMVLALVAVAAVSGVAAYALSARIAEHTAAFPGEVLLIHGDTHDYTFDHQLKRAGTTEMLDNFTRL